MKVVEPVLIISFYCRGRRLQQLVGCGDHLLDNGNSLHNGHPLPDSRNSLADLADGFRNTASQLVTELQHQAHRHAHTTFHGVCKILTRPYMMLIGFYHVGHGAGKTSQWCRSFGIRMSFRKCVQHNATQVDTTYGRINQVNKSKGRANAGFQHTLLGSCWFDCQLSCRRCILSQQHVTAQQRPPRCCKWPSASMQNNFHVGNDGICK